MSTVKQVIVVRADLGMSRGKMAAQAAHAAIGALAQATLDDKRHAALREWLDTGQTTVVLRIESEAELVQLGLDAGLRGIPGHLVVDEGRTEFGGKKTATCVGLGPDLTEAIDVVTGKLKVFQ